MVSSRLIMLRLVDPNEAKPWQSCAICSDKIFFRTPREFSSHLRQLHCTKEGGSFVCHYGKNGVCPSLPVEGVSDKDYEDHVRKNHTKLEEGKCIVNSLNILIVKNNSPCVIFLTSLIASSSLIPH